MRKSLFVTFLTLLLLFSIFQVVIAVDSEKPAEDFIEKFQAEIKKMDPDKELIDQRSEYSRSFRDNHGKTVTFIATYPLNYLGEDNKYYPIETDIVDENLKTKFKLFQALEADGDEEKYGGDLYQVDRFRYYAVKNMVKAYFAEDSEGGVLFEYQNKPIFFQLEPQYKRSAKIDKNKIRYEKIYENCDLEYTVFPGGVKDELIFYSLPERPVLSFKVDFGDLKPEHGPDGAVHLVDNSGNVIYIIHPSIIYEKENEENCIEIETRFHRQGNQLFCDLVLDMDWLKNKNRKYPIVVDPLVSAGKLDSFGKEERRFLFYAPESYGTIECEIEIDGPGYHGYFTEHNPARAHFKDLTAKETFLSFEEYHDWHATHKVNLVAGHYYEVFIYGGRSRQKIGNKKYFGEAWATIKYGGENGRLFEVLPPDALTLNTKVHKNEVEKYFKIKYPQTVCYSSNSSVAKGFIVYKLGEDGDDGEIGDERGEEVFSSSLNNGSFQLIAGNYKVVVPHDTWVELKFPRLTTNYESRIFIQGNPGSIDSTFSLPSDCEVKMQFKAAKNGSPSSLGYPFVKIFSGTQTIYERKFDVNYYNYFDGGDKVLLEKEVPYRLVVSRGHSANSGWGSLELELYYSKNQPCKITNLGLINDRNNPVQNRYTNGNHLLSFNYTDLDDNPLKEYLLTIEQTNSNKKFEFWLSPEDGSSDVINIPYLIRQFNFDPGSEILCQVSAWDGFDLSDSHTYNFTLDASPPIVDEFRGEVNISNNSIDLRCRVRDIESGLQSCKISWTVNGEPGGFHEFSQDELTYSISDLPYNAKVVVNMEALDKTGNKTNRHLTFFTYPQKAKLIAPKYLQSNTSSELKISKAEASLLRIERYIKSTDGRLELDYDTGYMVPSQLGISVVGYPQVYLEVNPIGLDFMQPASVILSAHAFDQDGKIAKVQFFNGYQYLGEVENSPYNLTVHNLLFGEYHFTARAIDDSGLETISAPVVINVKNSEPTVFIKNIKNNQSFTWPTDITIQAEAIDQDGTIGKVEFYVNNNHIGTATKGVNNIFSIVWKDVPVGVHSLVVKAFDNNDAVTSSTPVTIMVSPPPLGSYNVSFNCETYSGVKNTFTLYLPADRPAPGNHSYGPLGRANRREINKISDVKTFPCAIRVNYEVTIEDYKKRNQVKPKFVVTTGSEELLSISSYDTTRTGSFEIPPNSYIKISYYSGHHDIPKIGDDEDLGYNCSFKMTFEYIFDEDVFTSPQAMSLANDVEPVVVMQKAALQGQDTEADDEEVYSFYEPLPARSHETYVYRIYTRNGDKEVYTENEVAVINNSPKIVAMEPLPDLTTFSHHTLNFKMLEVVDEDGDALTYTYKISGQTTNGEDYTFGPITRNDWEPLTVTNLPDGNYTWTVQVKDEYQGFAEATGNLIVDKGQAVASFTINNGSRYTNDRLVTINIDDAYNVYRVRFSYDNQNWMEPVADWNNPIHLTLPEGEGKKTIYMQTQTEAQAAVGAWGPPVSIQRSIILDTTPPVIDSFNVYNQGGTDSVYFRWGGGVDNLSGIAGYQIQYWDGSELKDFQIEDNRITIPLVGYNVPVKLRIQLLDQAGNKSAWIENTGYTKAALGSLDLAETTSGYTPEDGHYIILKLNPAEGATKYKLICVENPGGGDMAEISGVQLYYKDTGLVPHGTYKYKLQTFNTNNEITEVELEPLQVANMVPEKPAGVAPKGYIDQVKGVSFEFARPLEQLDVDGDELEVQYLFSTDGFSYVELPNGVLDDLEEGQVYFWKARLSDGHGGVVETEPVGFTADITSPQIIVDNSSFDWALEHRVQITAHDNCSGIAELLVNGVPSESVCEILFNRQGANSLNVTAIDQAGNTANFSHVYYIDQTPPTINNIRFDLPEKNGTFLTGSNLVPAVWEGLDSETGILQFRYNWSDSNGWYDPDEMQPVSVVDQQGTYLYNFIGDFEDGKIYYLYIQAENRLGMRSEIVQSAPLLYDQTGPEVKITELNGGRSFNGFYYLSHLDNLRVSVESEDPHTGINGFEYALTEKVDPTASVWESVQWFTSLEELKHAVTPVNGQVYYLAVRAYNGTGLSTTVFSKPLIIDHSGPTLDISCNATQNDQRLYLAHITVQDKETMVTSLEYAIGSAPGQTDLSKGLPGANPEGWFSIEYPPKFMELRHYDKIPLGTTYYFTVKAVNICGGMTTVTSNGTKVIAGDRPVVRDDGSFTSEKDTLHFEWSWPENPGEVLLYEYRIRSTEGIVKDWCGTTDSSVLVTDLELQHNQVYFCDVRAILESGRISESGTSDGICVDLTLPEIIEFNYPAYAAGSGIFLNWSANDPESGVKCYIGVGTSPGETDLTKGWLNLGGLKQYLICQDTNGVGIDFIHGQQCYLTILVENGAGLTVQQISAPVKIDLTPPEPPVVLDEGNYTNRSDRLKFSWKWPLGDDESGIREYWCALTTKQSINGNEIWYCTLLEKEVLLDELELQQGGTYYLAVKAINNAGLESVGFSDGILVDMTAPTPPMVIDYGDFSLSNSELKVSMVASDAESGIAEYRLSLGTLTDPKSIIADQPVMSDGGIEHLDLIGLNLEEGQVYIFTICAVNHAGIVSMASTSDGIMVDSKLPVVQSVNVQGRYLTDRTRLVFDWTAEPSPSGIIDAQYALSEDPNGNDLQWQTADLTGSQVLTGLNLEDGKTYYLYIRAQNRALAENAPDVWSNPKRSNPFSIDTTPPEILRIHSPVFMPQRFLLQWEARDDVSGITEYRYAIGSYRLGTDVTEGWRSIFTQQTTVSFFLDDLPLLDGHDYYISVMAKNGAGLWSPVYTSEAIKAELTPPNVREFSYPSSYINCKDLENGIDIYWSADDPESGIAAYRVCFVTDKNQSNLDGALVVPTNQTSGLIHLTEFTLVDGGCYYLAFQAQNSLGAWSDVAYSNEILVDLTPPIVAVLKEGDEFVTNDGLIDLTWLLSENGFVEYMLIYPNGYETEPEMIAISGVYLHSFELPMELEGTYTLVLKPVDAAGNVGEVVTETIRLNAKPIANPGPDRRIFKGGSVTFTPEVADSDGIIVEYLWDFGNGETSTEAEPTCEYRELGEYLITLRVMDNDGKWSELGTVKVIVVNTSYGELNMDEDWEGDADISGDIIVPKGVTLRIKAGTTIDFVGDYKIIVYGRILIEGTIEQPVLFGMETNIWGGIRLINADMGSTLQHTQIYAATVGLVAAESNVTVEDCLFAHNRIGFHVLNSVPILKGCIFQENLIYGVKEDDGAAPTVINCSFINNHTIDYYEDQLGIISIDQLNELGHNKQNMVIK